MRLETFFEKFEQFTEAPNAVAKMRELIFELTATGRLIPEILENPVEDDTKCMGDLVELVMGQAPPGHECNTDGLGTVFVKVGEFGPLYPEVTVWTTKPLKFAKQGDVLVCVVGATVGKLNLAIDCAIGRSVAAIRPSSVLDTKFLYYSLIPYTLRLRRNARGSAQGVIGKTELNAVSLWVPSPTVQKRIVAKVDELMALCDRLESQQQERDTRHATLARAALARFADAPTPENLNLLFHQSYAIAPADIRKAILTLAVQGKLVPQALNDESAEKSLRLCGVKKTHRPVPDEEQRYSVPDSWVWIRFSEVGEQRLGKMLDAQKNLGKPKPYLRNTNVQWMRFELNDVKEMCIEESEGDKFQLKKGDLLICEGGEPGRCAIWNGEVPEMYIQKALHRVRPCVAIISEYLALNLQVDCQNDVLARYFTGATIKHLTGRSLSEYPVPIPPLAEQRRIVAKVDQLMALVDKLETELTASRTAATTLMEAVVAELTLVDKL